MVDSIPMLEKLNQIKQADLQRTAATERQVREAQRHVPGLRYHVAQRLVALATWLSPAHQEVAQTRRGAGGAPGHPCKRPT